MSNNHPGRGAGYLMQGLRLINQPGIRRFVGIPLSVNVLVISLLIWLGIHQFEALLNWLLPQGGWLAYLRWLAWPLFAATLLLLIFYSFTLIANLIAAPFNGLLAEKVAQHLGGAIDDSPVTWGRILRDIGPSVTSELRKLVYFLIRALPLLVLFLIPGINVIAALLWLLFNAWYMALEYADYPLGNRGLKFRDQLPRMKRIRLTALGFGLALTGLMLVPLLNFVAMPAAVAGATALVQRELTPASPADNA